MEAPRGPEDAQPGIERDAERQEKQAKEIAAIVKDVVLFEMEEIVNIFNRNLDLTNPKVKELIRAASEQRSATMRPLADALLRLVGADEALRRRVYEFIHRKPDSTGLDRIIGQVNHYDDGEEDEYLNEKWPK